MSFLQMILEKLTSIVIQDFVSIVAAAIAILAALYARWSARAAERANEIAIHTERLRIFKAVRHFQYDIETVGLQYSDAAQGQLIQGAELAEFYFAPKVSKSLSKLVDRSQSFINERSAAFVQDAVGQPIIPSAAREQLSAMHREVLADVKQNIDELKRHLRLG